jgi:ABC-type sugar transport system substrate-binding protein
MKTVKRSRGTVVLAALISLLPVMGCGGGLSSDPNHGDTASSAAGKSQFTVCLLPKIKGIAYFSSCAEGARRAAEELGNVRLIYDGPIDGDPKKQAELIEQWMVDGVDVVCVAPNAPDVVANAMREARRAGIQVITWDADGVRDARSYFVNQATAESIGRGMVRAMVHDLGGDDASGDVVIISSDATSDNQNRWIEVMKPALQETRLNLATIKYPGENASSALADAQDVIKKYPNLKGIFGISSVSFPGAAEAVKQAGRSGDILVTGLSTPNEMTGFVQDGTVKSVILWNTLDLGYLTVYVAEALASGKLTAGAASFSAGRLGELPIDGDQVILGDILVFTKQNIGQYDF